MSGTTLIRYDAMCHAIAAAYEVDEVKDIRDKAIAMEAYARQSRNTEAERRACEIRLRAERKCGELLKEFERSKGGRPSKNSLQSEVSFKDTREKAGISDTQAHRWQKLADIPEDQFEATFARPGKPSTNGMIAASKPQSQAEVEHRAMDQRALWVWGRLLDFERQNILDADPKMMAAEMLDHMRDTVGELGPKVVEWLKELICHVAA